jgi:hypothetical protein
MALLDVTVSLHYHVPLLGCRDIDYSIKTMPGTKARGMDCGYGFLAVILYASLVTEMWKCSAPDSVSR